MKNTKIIKNLSIILAALLIAVTVSSELVDAKSIYFSGEYSSKKGAVLNLSEYTGTTPEEDERHEVATYQFDVPHDYNAYSGILIKMGKNKYRSKKKGLIFKRELFFKNKIEFPIGKYYEDLGTTPMLTMFTDKIKFIPNNLYHYLKREDSIMNKVK